MDIILADVMGYCMGVKRAVDSACKALESNISDDVYTLGPLIHNPLVLRSFEEKGLKILESSKICEVKENSVVVIRAHGTTPLILDRLSAQKVKVIDATCPRVHLSQKRVAEWSSKGYSIVIAGDRNHGEVTSISGYAAGVVHVIQSAEEARNLEVNGNFVLIAQTTFSPVEFEEISRILLERNPEIKIFNSICTATVERQNALHSMEGKVEGIIVIGGKNSANTRRLYETASGIAGKACLIEKTDEIPSDFYNLGSVGITAGASTPGNVIEEVVAALRQLKK